MKVAVLGMGKMGQAVAGRLLEENEVVVWNRTPGKTDELRRAGAEEASSPAEAASLADVLVTSLADDSAVEAVLNGSEPVGSQLKKGSLVVEMSTISPETARRLAAAMDGRYVASPILGAPKAVSEGKALYLAAGPKERFEELTAFYESLSDQVLYLGEEVERALQLKLLANYLLLSGIAALGEFVSLSEAVGLTSEVLESFLNGSPLVADGLKNRIEGLLSNEHEGWFTTKLGAKDIRLLSELAKSNEVVAPLAEAVRGRYEEASCSHGDEDLTAVVELTRKR